MNMNDTLRMQFVEVVKRAGGRAVICSHPVPAAGGYDDYQIFASFDREEKIDDALQRLDAAVKSHAHSRAEAHLLEKEWDDKISLCAFFVVFFSPPKKEAHADCPTH